MFEQLLQGPSGEPITVEQLAAAAHFDAPDAMIDSPAEDNPDYAEVEEQISAAREQIERLTNHCFLPQQWRLSLDAFPTFITSNDWVVRGPFIAGPLTADAIELLRLPVGSVDSVKYIDTFGAEQTFDPSNYDVKGNRIVLKAGKSWPVAIKNPDSVWIDYTAGYDPDGSPAVSIPARLLRALKWLAGHYHETLLPISTEPTQDVKFTLSNLLTGFRSTRMAR
jgi:hypothetical protein